MGLSLKLLKGAKRGEEVKRSEPLCLAKGNEKMLQLLQKNRLAVPPGLNRQIV